MVFCLWTQQGRKDGLSAPALLAAMSAEASYKVRHVCAMHFYVFFCLVLNQRGLCYAFIWIPVIITSKVAVSFLSKTDDTPLTMPEPLSAIPHSLYFLLCSKASLHLHIFVRKQENIFQDWNSYLGKLKHAITLQLVCALYFLSYL